MSKTKINFKPWGDDDNPGKEVVSIAWNGTKMVVFAAVAGLALGLGLGAYGAASGG